MNTDRRRIVRVSPKDPTYVVLRPMFTKLGRLLDISENGLCFQYMSEKKHTGALTANMVSLEIDLFISNNGCYLPSLPCKLVYDSGGMSPQKLPVGLEDRRCGLKFGRLSKRQAHELIRYLNDHTA